MSRDQHDQLDRSLRSILANIAEAAGKTARADKRRIYEVARGSAMETATHIDILCIRGIITANEYNGARQLLLRTVKMLSRLAAPPR